jgi:hypothetical protein
MKAGTTPSVTPEPDGTYEFAVEANTSDLGTIHLGTGCPVNTTTLGMDAGTSPSLATPPTRTNPRHQLRGGRQLRAADIRRCRTQLSRNQRRHHRQQ